MRLPPCLRAALDQSGLPWTLTPGTRHRQLRLNGRLIGILPYGRLSEADRATKNLVAQVRRRARS